MMLCQQPISMSFTQKESLLNIKDLIRVPSRCSRHDLIRRRMPSPTRQDMTRLKCMKTEGRQSSGIGTYIRMLWVGGMCWILGLLRDLPRIHHLLPAGVLWIHIIARDSAWLLEQEEPIS